MDPYTNFANNACSFINAEVAYIVEYSYGTLVVGGVQFIGMILIIAIQAIMMTNQWDEFLAIIEMALPASVLNGLLDCLLVPPLTLLVRHYTENVKKE